MSEFKRQSIRAGKITTGKLVVSSSDIELCFKEGSVGPKVSFNKPNYYNQEFYKDVIIPGVLELARGNNGGLYNIAVEDQFHWNTSPLNTEWNTQFVNPENVNWAPLHDIQNREYDIWREAVEVPEGDYVPPLYVGTKAIMHETTTDRYWLFVFTNWTPNNNGGGFAYDRWEIYPEVEFNRPNYEEDVVDYISAGVQIARGSYGGQIYNKVNETEAQVGVSPKNTRWNSIYTDSRGGFNGFSDLSNLEDRVYTDFIYALDYAVGSNIIGTELIMHDLTTDLYYKVVFDFWQSGGNGGGFTYRRQVIPQSCPIVFGDGSSLTTAKSTPYVDKNSNLIVADSSKNIVNVGYGDSHLIDNFSGMLIVNDHDNGGIELWIAGGGNSNLVSYVDLPGNSSLNMSSNGYEWVNNDNLNGPFTFTVVKTRNEA